MNDEGSPGPRALPGSLAACSGWLMVAVGNLLGILARPLGPGGVVTRIEHAVFDFGHMLTLGLVAAGAVAGWARFGPRRRGLATLALGVAASVLGMLLLPDDLDGTVERLLGEGQDVEAPALVLAELVALVIPGAFAAGRLLARPRWRALGMLLGPALVVVNENVLVNGYPGLHTLMAGVAATLFGAAVAGAPLPARIGRYVSRRRVWPVLVVGSAAALASVLVEAPRAARAELLARDTALLARWLGGSLRVSGAVPIPAALRPWFEPRTGRADVPPTPTRLLPEGAIVLLVTIDALRLEVLDPEHARDMPNLHALLREGVSFSQARSFGSDTRYSLAALFSGRYFSMMNWTWRSRLRPTLENDDLPRLPELLHAERVATATGVSLPGMLVPRIGIVRGFDEQYVKNDEDKKPGTEEVIDQAIERLKRQGPGSLFYFTHLIDPHAPYYKHGRVKKEPHEAYLGEVSFADKHLGRLMRAIDELGLASRTALIVSSDHGEGFGEHGIYFHNKPLYEVMVHVPLLVRIPGVRPRTIDAHVSMMDIGPTVLDLLGVPTPGYFMAESLVPLLLGQPPAPNRLIFMEKPTERALLFPDGIKVMLRTKPRSEEIYDLGRDPGEEHDLRDELGAEGDRRVALARAYAEAHATTKASAPKRRPR